MRSTPLQDCRATPAKVYKPVRRLRTATRLLPVPNCCPMSSARSALCPSGRSRRSVGPMLFECKRRAAVEPAPVHWRPRLGGRRRSSGCSTDLRADRIVQRDYLAVLAAFPCRDTYVRTAPSKSSAGASRPLRSAIRLSTVGADRGWPARNLATIACAGQIPAGSATPPSGKTTMERPSLQDSKTVITNTTTAISR